VLIMILDIIGIILNIVWLVVIVQAIMSWLLAFNVISTSNDLVNTVWTALGKVTEPLYRPLRRFIPNFGAMDITPLVVLLGLLILRGPVLGYFYRSAIMSGMA
jgi:YggT family protein